MRSLHPIPFVMIIAMFAATLTTHAARTPLPSSTASYSIRDLNPAPHEGMWPVAVNDDGEVVGSLTARGDAFIESGTHIVDLGIPSGFTRTSAMGVSSAGAVLISASKTIGGTFGYFVATRAGSTTHWKRLRSGLPGYAWPKASQMDAEGDVIGTVRRAHAGNSERSDRAAIWLAQSDHDYARATLLPNALGTTGATGQAIWNGSQRVVVAGCSLAENQDAACMTFWMRTSKGTFRVSNAVDESGAAIEHIGGNPGRVFASAEDCDGYDRCAGWAARVTFSNEQASIKIPFAFPAPPEGGLIWGLNGVTAGSDGKVVAIGAGGTQSPPVIWKGGHVYKLQSQLGAKSGWTLSTANALNDNGQIVGTGQLHGRAHAYVLTPLGCACY